MAAGLGFKTFTTGEVLTAADTNGYLMQGVLVFASAAARTSAITSPQEGQYSYLKDTNALEFYDGAAWTGAPVGDITAVTAGTGLSGGGSSGDVTVSINTAVTADLTTSQTLTNKTLTTPKISNYTTNGDLVYGTGSGVITRLGIGSTSQVLTVTGGVPVWATPAASTSGFNLISTTAFTTSSAVNVNSVFSATYTAYRIVADFDSSTADDALLFRVRVSGTDNSTAGNYKWAGYYSTTDSAGGGNQQGGTSATSWSGGSVTSTTHAQTIIDIVNPFASAKTTYYGYANGNGLVKWFGGNMTVTTSYTGFSLIPGAGTITGSVSVYGYGI